MIKFKFIIRSHRVEQHIFCIRLFQLFVLIAFSVIQPEAFAAGKAKSAGAATSSLQGECEKQAAEVEHKFKFKIDRNQEPVSFANADPRRLCVANDGAALDKRIQEDDSALSKSCPDSSVCRSTYVALKDAIADYKSKIVAACLKLRKFEEGCGSPRSDDDPKEAFRCVAEKAREAELAQKEAADTLAKALELAGELRDHANKVQEAYQNDLQRIREAYQRVEAKIEAARAAGDAAQVQALTDLKKKATSVKDGELVEGASLLDYAKSAGGGVNSLNGGQETLASYEVLLGENDSAAAKPQIKGASNVTGLLIKEQDWAIQATNSFQTIAQKEIDDLRSKATHLSGWAQKNESIARGNVNGTGSSNSEVDFTKVTGTGLGAMNLGTVAQAGAAATSLSGLMGTSTSGGASGSISGTGASSRGSSSGLVSDGSNSSGTLSSGDGSKSDLKSSTLRKGNNGRLGPESASPGVGGRDSSDFSNRPGVAAERRSESLDSTLAPSVAGASGSLGLGKGAGASSEGALSKASARSIASKSNLENHEQQSDPKPTGCLGAEKACTPVATNSPQSAFGATIGAALVGIPEPAFPASGSLDDLFGSTLDIGGPKLEDKSAPELNGLISPFEDSSAQPGQATQASVLADEQSNSRSLFARVHSIHEKAIRKGSVSLLQKKLE